MQSVKFLPVRNMAHGLFVLAFYRSLPTQPGDDAIQLV
jgi:hypothetical protein